MPLSIIFAIPVLLSIAGFMLGRRKARQSAFAGETRLHSLPKYHGYLAVLMVMVPGMALIVAWLLFEPSVLNSYIRALLPSSITQGLSPSRLGLIVGEVRQAAAGITFGEPSAAVVAAAERFKSAAGLSRWILAGLLMLMGAAAIVFVLSRIHVRFKARNNAERIVKWLLIGCATVSILATVGILFSLIFEGLRFFAVVSPIEFFFGTKWDPQIAIRADQVGSTGAFGAVPIFVGTFVIAATAMAVALPVGLFSAIYMSEFAPRSVRGIVKPLIEVLAGIPTIVYGFFAVLVVSPAIRGAGEVVGVSVSPTAAIVPGLVMGVMIIPFISSLTDDALNAVPQSLRDGSFGLGANKAETVTRVVMPAALPGIVGGILLASSRAIGETMIVVMAAGLTANLTANPLEGVTTVTVQIVSLLTGDTEFDSPKTLAAFGLGLTLFIATLGLNLIALQIVKHFREQYD